MGRAWRLVFVVGYVVTGSFPSIKDPVTWTMVSWYALAVYILSSSGKRGCKDIWGMCGNVSILTWIEWHFNRVESDNHHSPWGRYGWIFFVTERQFVTDKFSASFTLFRLLIYQFWRLYDKSAVLWVSETIFFEKSNSFLRTLESLALKYSDN